MAKHGDRSDNNRVVLGFLRPIDTDRIARDLRILDSAVEQGKNNRPPTDTEAYDLVEQTIIQKLESEWTWQGGELLNQLRSYAARLLGYSIDAEFTRLQLRANDAITTLRAANHRAEAELGPLREHFVATRKEHADFKVRYRISRPSRAPSHRWTSFGLLFVLLAIESAFNGIFFAKGSDYGLIGGVGTAVGISLVNVLIAFALGLGPARWLRHSNFLFKLAGLFLLITASALLIALHGFAAHLREATIVLADEDLATKAAWDALWQTPLALHDLNSIYLFALGLVFGFVAMYKGYVFDDPFPGYGAVTRRLLQARDDYSDEHSLLFDDLEEIKDGSLSDLTKGIVEIPLFPQSAENIRKQRATILEQFRAYEGSIEGAVRQLLAKYRDANAAARSSPPQAHFTRLWSLPRSFLSSSEVAVLLSEPDRGPTDSATALAELKHLSSQIMSEYEKLISSYPHPTQMASS